ncbi:MAG: hypothetical protein FWE54_06040 [Methanimicrococcus sp.]|nr:hypothetical protein [Methanimicrococcus sp.]
MTTKKRSVQENSIRRTFFNIEEADLVPIDPIHPFPKPCFAKLKCHYIMEYFADIDNLIHYGGESVHDSVIEDIKNGLWDCNNKKYFSESDIKAFNRSKFRYAG